MNKSEQREVAQLMSVANNTEYAGYVARGMSALIRSTMRSRNELMAVAATVTGLMQHPDFLV